MPDVELTLTIPDAYVNRAVDAMCGEDDRAYNSQKEEGETRGQFAQRIAKAQCVNTLKRVVQRFEDTKPEEIEVI